MTTKEPMCVREEATWQCQLASCTSNRHFTLLEETLWVSQGLYLENREVTGKESLVVSTTWREYRESCLTSHWFPLPRDPRREISRNLSLSSEESGVWRQNKTQWQQIVLKVNSLRLTRYCVHIYLPSLSCFLLASASTEFFQFPCFFEAMMDEEITKAKSKKKREGEFVVYTVRGS